MQIEVQSVMVVHADKSETPFPPELYNVVGNRIAFNGSYTLAKDEVIAVSYSVSIDGLEPQTVRCETSPNLVLYYGVEISPDFKIDGLI